MSPQANPPEIGETQRGLIRALARGLRVLRAIRHDAADPASLALVTGVDRTTIYRILHTLEAEGYVVRRPSDHRFMLTREVRKLADGFTEAEWVTQIGAVEIGTLHRAVGWPTNLATFDGERMLVRESTHRFSSLMIHRTMVGERVQMGSSLGMAFAAHVAPELRDIMIGLVASDAGVSPTEAGRRLKTVRKQGHAIVSEALEADIGAIAAPVFHQGVVVAAINIVVPVKLMPTASIVHKLREPLLEAAKSIELGIAAIPDGAVT